MKQPLRGNFFNLITMGISEFYVKNLAREAFAGQMQNEKRALSAGGPPPLGYQYTKDKRLVIELKEAEAVRLLFDMFLEGYDYRTIAKTLNGKGYRTRHGNPFTLNIRQNLSNRKYIGEYVFNQMAKKSLDGSSNHRVLKPESEVIRIPNAHPSIIDEETYNKVQILLKSRKHSSNQTCIRGKYLLTGLVKCVQCGYCMSGHTNHSGKGGHIRVIYRCRTKLVELECSTKSINILYLHAYVLKQLRELMNQRNRKKFLALLKSILETKKVELEEKLKDTEERIELYKIEIQNLTNLIASSKRSLDNLLTEEMNDFMSELDAVHALVLRLQKDKTQLSDLNPKIIQDKFKTLSDKLNHPDIRKKAVFQLIKEIIILNDVIHIVFIFNTLLEHDIQEDLVFKHTVKREHITFKQNHDQWETVLS